MRRWEVIITQIVKYFGITSNKKSFKPFFKTFGAMRKKIPISVSNFDFSGKPWDSSFCQSFKKTAPLNAIKIRFTGVDQC